MKLPFSSKSITVHIALIVGHLLLIFTLVKSDLFGLPYAGKTTREYLVEFQPKLKRNLSEVQFEQLLNVQEALGDRILQFEIKKAEKKKMVHLEKVDAWMSTKEYKALKILYEEAGMSLDSAEPTRVNGMSGEQLTDERTGELCYVLPLEKKRFEQANRAYFARTKRELKVNACGRGRGRQTANKIIVVGICLIGGYGSFEGNLKRMSQATNKDIQKCHRKTSSRKAKSPVGGILTSRHSFYAGMDIKNHASGKGELTAAGFSCGLSKKYLGIKLGSGDKNHCWLVK